MLIEVEGSNGHKVTIEAATICRLRYTDPNNRDSGTRIDYGGGVLFSRELTEGLLKRIAPDVRMVQFTTRIPSPTWIRPEAVTLVQSAIPMNAPGTEMIVGGSYQHVMEEYSDVLKMLQGRHDAGMEDAGRQLLLQALEALQTERTALEAKRSSLSTSAVADLARDGTNKDQVKRLKELDKEIAKRKRVEREIANRLK